MGAGAEAAAAAEEEKAAPGKKGQEREADRDLLVEEDQRERKR